MAVVRWRIRFGTFSVGFPLLGEAGVRKRSGRGYITIKRARMIISAFGWYKHTDSFNVRQKLKVDEMVALAKSKISMFEKGGADVEILHKYSNAENLLLCPS